MEIQKKASLEGLTWKDFIPSNKWSDKGPEMINFGKNIGSAEVKIVKDEFTQKKFIKQSKIGRGFVGRSVAAIGLFTFRVPLVATAAQVIRIAKVISGYALWKSHTTSEFNADGKVNNHPLKSRFKELGKDALLSITWLPAFFMLELSVLLIPLDPQNGFKLVDSWSNIIFEGTIPKLCPSRLVG